MSHRYIRYIRLNQNIFFGFIASFIVSAIITQLFSELSSELNATIALVADFVTYYAVFATLHWYMNKKLYYTSNGTIDRQKFYKDITGTVISLGIGEVAYAATRWYLQHYLLTMGVEPYHTSIFAQLVATVIYFGIVNLIIWTSKIYKHEN